MGPPFTRGISNNPEEFRMGPPRVFGPESIRLTNKGYEFDVRLGSRHTMLPLLNVGSSENPVWIAYANVRENKPLSDIARPLMAARIAAQMRRNPEISFVVGPQSDKSQEFARAVVREASRSVGWKIPYVQLIGGTDQGEVQRLSAPGLTTECTSVVSKARGIVKTLGMTQRDRGLIQSLGGKALWIDDVANTRETQEKSLLLVNRALRLPEGTAHPSHVLFLESVYGQGYPKPFPGIDALGHLPEFVGELPYRPKS
jgi:hypothetical protein